RSRHPREGGNPAPRSGRRGTSIFRHSRARGNPASSLRQIPRAESLDSRVRGSDGGSETAQKPGESAMDRQPAVYMLASGRNGTLYIGVTSDLVGRTWQHREHTVDGFTKKYGVTRLVWYELADTMEAA